MRPIGERIITAMEILDREGPSQYSLVAMHMEIEDHTNASNYLRRAVALGLATVDKSGPRNIYASAPDWRDRLHKHSAIKTVRKPKVHKPLINSVWALGLSATINQ